MSQFPRYSVVIVNFNGRQYLEDCLASLASCSYPRDQVEWIVVDNGSNDGSVEFVRSRFPTAVLVELEKNTGFVGGIAAGVAIARGQYLAFLNNDMRVNPSWLEAYDAALADSGAPCATGTILSWDGRSIDFVRGLLMFDGHALQLYQGADASTAAGLSVHRTFIACGGNMVVERELFLRLGGFDDDYFAYTEDVDFSWRLYAGGYSIVFAPDALVYHHQQGTSNRLGVYRRGFLFERNAFMTLFKNVDPQYFSELMYLAWITLTHRSREIVRLYASGSEIFSIDPYREITEPSAVSHGNGLLSFLRTSFSRFRSHSRQYGMRATLGRGLIRLGERFSPPGTSVSGTELQIDMSHPHIVSQFQAICYILNNFDRLEAKRRQVQQLCCIPGRELFQEFPPWIVTTYPGDDRLFAQRSFRDLLPQDIPFRFATLDDVNGRTANHGDHSDL